MHLKIFKWPPIWRKQKVTILGSPLPFVESPTNIERINTSKLKRESSIFQNEKEVAPVERIENSHPQIVENHFPELGYAEIDPHISPEAVPGPSFGQPTLSLTQSDEQPAVSEKCSESKQSSNDSAKSNGPCDDDISKDKEDKKLQPTSKRGRLKSRLRKRINCSLLICSFSIDLWALVLMVILAIVFIVCGVVVWHKKKQTQYVAYKGTGLVSIDLADGHRNFDTFYMLPDTSVVRTQFRDGIWSNSSTKIDVVSANVEPGKPIMAVSYINGNELSWRVIYVGKDGFLHEAMSNNQTQNWWEGSLAAAELEFAANGIGLTACVNNRYYGTPGDGLGIRLYYSAAPDGNSTEGGEIQELIWEHGSEVWRRGYRFPDSVAGGVECVVRGTSTTHVWMQNSEGLLQQYWYDADNATTPHHPTNTWVKGVTHSGMRSGSAIGAIQVNQTRYVHYQSDDGSLWQITAEGNAENTTLLEPIKVGDAMIGTKISALVLNTTMTGQEIHVFAQTDDRKIIDFVRTVTGDTWAVEVVPSGS